MEEILFAPAWWMLAAGVILAVGLFFVGNMRLNSKLRAGSAAVLLLTVLWYFAGRMVETPMEAAEDGTKRFVQAAVARDTATMGNLLSGVASIGRFGKGDIIETTPEYAEQWGLKGALVSGTEIEQRGGQYVTRIRVISQHESSKTGLDTLSSDWEFSWAREGDQWKIVQIVPLKIGTTDVRGVMDRYFGQRR